MDKFGITGIWEPYWARCLSRGRRGHRPGVPLGESGARAWAVCLPASRTLIDAEGVIAVAYAQRKWLQQKVRACQLLWRQQFQTLYCPYSMQSLALADFLENRELELLYRWIQAYAGESPRYHRAVHAVSPAVFVTVFKQVLGLLRGREDAAKPIGHGEFYIKESDRRHISDIMELLMSGEVLLRGEILRHRPAVSYLQAAADLEQLNAAIHRLLYVHAGEFCADCEDVLLDYCRQVNERAAGLATPLRGIKPLHDPFANRSLAYLPPVHRQTTVQETLSTFMRTHRNEILARWVSLLDDDEGARFRARVESVDTTLSELLDEVLASVGCCTLRPPPLRTTPAPCDAAPNALHVILVGEEAIAGLLRSTIHDIDESFLNLRAHLNEGFHQLLRKNVASECGRCKNLLGASRHRLRAIENKMFSPKKTTTLNDL